MPAWCGQSILGIEAMEPFKNYMSPDGVGFIALHLDRHLDDFDPKAFKHPLLEELPALELKQRTQLIADAVNSVLPTGIALRNEILAAMLHPDPLNHADKPSDNDGICGWGLWPLTMVVGQHGLEEFDGSLALLKEMTKRGTAEFDVRPFLAANQARALNIITAWATGENIHVRRLASEGTRPRLPWGMQLKQLIADPKPTLPILSAMRDDPEDYVRRSVANHLNDIAKDHPELVAQIATDWMTDAKTPRQKLLRHGCRTLIKQGHEKALRAFGVMPPVIEEPVVGIETSVMNLGEDLTFSVILKSRGQSAQKIVLDYVVHFQRANGTLSPKVFKWKQITLKPDECLNLSRNHSIRPITTRKYYAGEHALSLRINGVDYSNIRFELRT
jgi:3-methyladenine DNA glycosylase AlkC